MTREETISLPRTEYEVLMQRLEDFEDVVAAMDADRTSSRIPHALAVAIARGGRPITVFREDKGLSLRELARRARVSAGYLCQIEHGTKAGSAAVLARIAQELGTTIDTLMIGNE